MALMQVLASALITALIVYLIVRVLSMWSPPALGGMGGVSMTSAASSHRAYGQAVDTNADAFVDQNVNLCDDMSEMSGFSECPADGRSGQHDGKWKAGARRATSTAKRAHQRSAACARKIALGGQAYQCTDLEGVDALYARCASDAQASPMKKAGMWMENAAAKGRMYSSKMQRNNAASDDDSAMMMLTMPNIDTMGADLEALDSDPSTGAGFCDSDNDKESGIPARARAVAAKLTKRTMAKPQCADKADQPLFLKKSSSSCGVGGILKKKQNNDGDCDDEDMLGGSDMSSDDLLTFDCNRRSSGNVAARAIHFLVNPGMKSN